MLAAGLLTLGAACDIHFWASALAPRSATNRLLVGLARTRGSDEPVSWCTAWAQAVVRSESVVLIAP